MTEDSQLLRTTETSLRVIEAMREAVPPELADRVTARAGDYRTDDLGEGDDLALVFNVVHAHDPAENAALFERVGDALAPGGRIAVLDQWEGSGRTPVGRAGLRFVALTYLTTLGATVYSTDEVADWLRSAGFTDVRTRSVGPLSGIGVVEGTLPRGSLHDEPSSRAVGRDTDRSHRPERRRTVTITGETPNVHNPRWVIDGQDGWARHGFTPREGLPVG